ncbi:caspase family protein [uncultured Hyphomicrobium sp.]|uniref:caspase family protein n=1 Tax=uncultured Hyphomicrobium sp. TaxID=194373 RepID=UPI0025F3D280|nr:caspase family protein [uncultured Hyphomicrobium sp.]
MSALRSSAVALAAACVVAFASATSVPASPKTTHLLAMGACPPWKVIEGDPDATRQMAESCKNDVNAIVSAVKTSLAVDPANITIRLDPDATSKGVREALQTLDKRAKREDRVVIYFNFHGGNVDANYNGYDIEDEILAMYTAKEPEDFKHATMSGDWMTMKSVRDLVNEIDAEEIVLIFEVCEVSSGLKNFRYNFARRQQRDWVGREAVIFTSRGDQAATFNEEGSLALFTELFSKGLESAKSGNLRDVFEQAAIDTHRSRRATCMKDENLATLYDNRFVYLDACTQLPSAYDPYGLLDDIHVGGATVASRWHEIKDRKTPERKIENKEDPFAWTNEFMGQQSSGYGQPQAPQMIPVGPYAYPQ